MYITNNIKYLQLIWLFKCLVNITWAGEMAQWLWALAAFPKDKDSNPAPVCQLIPAFLLQV